MPSSSASFAELCHFELKPGETGACVVFWLQARHCVPVVLCASSFNTSAEVGF